MQHVKIRVKGQIDPHWSEWFDDLEITYAGQEQSTLTGIVPDQAALYGILTRLRDLGLSLISVAVETDASTGVNKSEQKGDVA